MDIIEKEENYYTINHVVLFTGLSDRTIRNYIAMGMLQGVKVSGQWRFTTDQVEEFVTNPAVRPSILAKKNALIYDFLADTKKNSEQNCVILDILEDKKKHIAFRKACRRLERNTMKDLGFFYDAARCTGCRVPKLSARYSVATLPM